MRILPQHVHACLDYPLYASLVVLPFLLGLGMTHPMAFVLMFGFGVAGLVMTALTDHETGLVAVIPFGLHLVLEAIGGAALVASALVLGFAGIDLVASLIVGAVMLGCLGLHRPAPALVPAE